jgi:protein-tyrosine phosphatase
MHPDAAVVLENLGGDPSNFVARRASEKVASHADLILTMTKQHRTEFLEVAPRHLHRTFTLSEASQICSRFDPQSIQDLKKLRPLQTEEEFSDIADPMGQSFDFFEKTALNIAELLPPILELCRCSN